MIFIQPITPSVFDKLERSGPFIPAPNSRRFINYIVDLVCAYLFVNLCVIIIGITGQMANADWVYLLWYEDSAPATALQNIVHVSLFVSYYTLIEFILKGRSVGKMITQTIAVRNNGTPIAFKQAFVRSIFRIIPFEPFGAFANRLWHDRFSRTKVVMNRKS